MKATEEFTRCERFEDTENGLRFNWYFSYEGYLAHNQEALKKAKSSPNSDTVPPVMIICHEFFDALPSMIFEKTESGWVEKLVDLNIESQSG